jgi:hypothetical protein
MNGFHQGILRLAMEPSVLGLAIVEGGPDRQIKLDRRLGLMRLLPISIFYLILFSMIKCKIDKAIEFS